MRWKNYPSVITDWISFIFQTLSDWTINQNKKQTPIQTNKQTPSYIFLLLLLMSAALSLVGNSDRLTWVRNSSRKSSATHSYLCVWYFHVFKLWYGCRCSGFLTFVQILMHVIARRGCTDTVRVRTENWFGDKSLATPGTWTRVNIAPGFSVGRSTNRAIPVPSCCLLKLCLRQMFKPNKNTQS